MLEITCYDNDGKKLDHLTQWDMGQTVSVKGATYVGSPVFHFCNRRSYRAYAVESTTQDDSISAKIPNALLKEPYPIEAYMYYQKGPGSAKTVYAFSIPVMPRKQPDDYIYLDNADVISLIEIKKEMTAALEELRTAIQDSKDSIVQVTTVIDEAKAATQEATSASASANAAAETAAQATTDARAAIQEAGHATEAATQAATTAGQAAASATNAAQSATDAANKANTAARRVDTAIQNATTATGNANTAAESATTAAGKADASAGKADASADKADAATAKANDAATAATGASEKANTAATQATDAAKTATNATATATSAASKADAAATAANESSAKATQAATEAIAAKNEASTAATTATESAGRADIATQGANTAAEAANAAAKAANDAAEKAKIDVAGKLDKPTAAPKVNDVLKVESVNPDGSFNAIWSEPPATVVVDETLQNAGQAADAAKTGEELKKLDKNKENVIVKSAFGESVILDDSGEAPLASMKLFGKTTQDGTPTPDTPVPLVSPGDDGDITITVSSNGDPQIITIPTPNGLPGIKVPAGGNYTDSTGQQWLCDEVDLERGVYVKRVGIAKISKLKYETSFNTVSRFSKDISMQDNTLVGRALFTHLPFIDANYSGDYEHFYIWNSTIYVFLRNEIAKDQNGIDAWMLKNNLMAVYVLENPVETPLSPELIAVYRALHTNYPNTNILNDEGCEMSVSYFTDTEVGRYIGGLSRSSVRTDPATKSPVTLGYDDGGLYIMTE